MSLRIHLLSGACCVCLIAGGTAAADESGGAPTVGQVRTLAISPRDHELLQALAHQGWIEAEGQILSIQTYHSLYRAIGRTWTPARVPSDEFALPDLDRRGTSDLPAIETTDSNGVLGPGDLVTGGRRQPATGPSLLHFIYAGRDASGLHQP